MPGPAPLHPALPPQVRGQAQEALRAALYASSLVFTEVVMALAGPPRSHENELLLEGYFHCENMGGD